MVKGAGDPFLLHQGLQQAKPVKKSGGPETQSAKSPQGTFRDPKVLEIAPQ